MDKNQPQSSREGASGPLQTGFNTNQPPPTGGMSQLTAPPMRRPGPMPRSSPFSGGSNGGSGDNVAPLTQNGIIKSVQQMLPKQGDVDQERQSVREQFIDALIRENSMNRQKLHQMQQMIEDYVSEQQQQSKQSQNNDECSSGGTNPCPSQNEGTINSNRVNMMIKLAVWLEESINDKHRDSRSNYKTMSRRIAQQIRTKEDQKQTLMTCTDRESVGNFLLDFANQRGGQSAGRVHGGGSQIAQGTPGTGAGSGASSIPAGGAAIPSSSSQEQSAQQTNSNPFAAPMPRGGMGSRGGPFGAQRGGIARGGRGRAMPRFAAPPQNMFAAPASSGSQMFGNPPLPGQDSKPDTCEEQKQAQDQSNPPFPTPSSSHPPSQQFMRDQTPQKQMIESGSADDSTFLMTPLSPKSKQNNQANNNKTTPTQGPPRQTTADAGSGFSLDFMDYLGSGPSGGNGQKQTALQQENKGKDNQIDFLNDFLNIDATSGSSPSNLGFKKGLKQEGVSGGVNMKVADTAGSPSGSGTGKYEEQSNQQNSTSAQEQRECEEEKKGEQAQESQNSQNNVQGLTRSFEYPSDFKIISNDNQGIADTNSEDKWVGAGGQDNGRDDQERPDNENEENEQVKSNPAVGKMLEKQNEQNSPTSQKQQQPETQQPYQSNHQSSSNYQHDGNSQSENKKTEVDQSLNMQNDYPLDDQIPSSLAGCGTGSGQHNQEQSATAASLFESSNNQQESQQQDYTSGAASGQIHSKQTIGAAVVGQTSQFGDAANLFKEEDSRKNLQLAEGASGTAPSIKIGDFRDLTVGETGAQQEMSSQNNCDNLANKRSSGKLSSKNQSGRMTPPSGSSARGKRSSRIVGDIMEINPQSSQSNFDETGSLNQQFVDQQSNFIPPYSTKYQSYNPSNQLRAATESFDQLSDAHMRDKGSLMLAKGVGVSFNDDISSEYKSSTAHKNGFGKKAPKTLRIGNNNQVEGFMQSHQISMPPESVASVSSIPITSFEDTQQMIRAYKKKKRELNKMKEAMFKIETEFITTKQRNISLEEELHLTQKKLIKLEKQTKNQQMREIQKDTTLIEKNLMLKTKEAEVYQTELQNQKKDNQKLREKVRDLLKKCNPNAQPLGSDDINSLGSTAASLNSITQKHQLTEMQLNYSHEMAKQKEALRQDLRKVQDDMTFYKQKCERIQKEMEESEKTIKQMKENEWKIKEGYDKQIQDLQRRHVADIQSNQQRSQNMQGDQTNEIKQLQDENLKMYNQLQESRDKILADKIHLSRQQDEIMALNGQLTQKQQTIDKLQQENQALREHQEKLEAENQDLKQKVQQQDGSSQSYQFGNTNTQSDNQNNYLQVNQDNQASSSQGFSIQHDSKDGKDSKKSSVQSSQNYQSTNSWQVLDQSMSQGSKILEQKTVESVDPANCSPSQVPPSDGQKMKNENLMINNDYFSNAQNAQDYFTQEVQEVQEEEKQEQKQKMLKPRQDNVYDFTLDGSMQVQEENKDLIPANMFSDGGNNQTTDVSKVYQVFSQPSEPVVVKTPSPPAQPQAQKPQAPPVYQPAPVPVANPQPPSTEAFQYNNDPYNFFVEDDDNDNDGGQSSNQIGQTANITSNSNVIPNSMFD